jgi:UDP-galactopyranose mutase
MKPYDFLIVGAGLFGAVFAHEMNKIGKRCWIVDKRSHAGGNIFCEDIEGVNVHSYGAHIFHTNDKDIWDYVNSFVDFNRYTNSPLAMYQGKLYNLPFNMNTFNQLWGSKTPVEAMKMIVEQTKNFKAGKVKNLEEQALSMVGTDIYEKLIKGYTEKQWGRAAKDLPAFIIKRIPLRFTYDNNYFDDRYQGIPIGGYNILINKLLNGIKVDLNVDFLKNKTELESMADKIIYTGKIDEYYNYQFGELEYRSLSFKHKLLEMENYQGNAVVNYTEREIPYTRIIEHKHFQFGNQKSTVITEEYPVAPGQDSEPYYPINDDINNRIYKKYKDLGLSHEHVVFGGRLGEFKYYDMHQVIASSLKCVKAAKKVLP